MWHRALRPCKAAGRAAEATTAPWLGSATPRSSCYASVMGRSEIVALSLADVEYKPAGVLIDIRKSKMDKRPRSGGCCRLWPARPHRSRRGIRRLAGYLWEMPGAVHPDLGELSQARTAVRTSRRSHARAREVVAGLGTVSGSLSDHCALLANWACRSRRDDWCAARPDRGAGATQHLTVLVNRYIGPLEALATTSSRDLAV